MRLVNNITDWLRQLIIALILAGFIEMLIPENNLKKVTKLVMGLMVMLILVQPLIRFFKIPLELDQVLSLNATNNLHSSQQVLNRGLRIRNRWEKSFHSEQQALTKERIESIIGLIDKIDLKEMRLLDSGTGSCPVLIRVAPSSGVKLSAAEKDRLTLKIQNSVRLVCGLSKEQIEVIWDESD